MNRIRRVVNRLSLSALLAVASFLAHAELSAEELAKLAQNPVANLISVPFQYNANLNYRILRMRVSRLRQLPRCLLPTPASDAATP
jgi:hypothetical protein